MTSERVRSPVTEDATLSDFEPGADDREGETEGEPGPSETAPETPTATYAWGDRECDRCGGPTERVWHDESAFVCPACKRW